MCILDRIETHNVNRCHENDIKSKLFNGRRVFILNIYMNDKSY